MPGFIKTPRDESRWRKAKEAASKTVPESAGDSHWKLANYIYHKMNKTEVAQSLIEKLSKQGEDDDNNEMDIQDYGQDGNLDEEDLRNMSVIDPSEEGSEGEDWLKENDPERQEVQEKKPSKSGYSEWKPREDYTEQEQSQIKGLMDEGYSHREAERMAGAHKNMPTNFQDALTHPLKPSQPSEKMLGRLRDLAKPWLENASKYEKIHADPDKNPQKHAAGKMLQAHESATKDYNKAYNDFLASDTVKGMKGLDRHKAVQAWKQQWKQENPEYGQEVGKVSEAQKHYVDAAETQKKNLDERMKHIASGGLGDPNAAMSMQEAAQHVGGTKGGEDEGYSAGTAKDPSASFASSNPQYVNMLRGKQEAEAPAAPKKNVSDIVKVIRKRAHPDHVERFERVMSARAAQGVGGGNKPEGEGA